MFEMNFKWLQDFHPKSKSRFLVLGLLCISILAFIFSRSQIKFFQVKPLRKNSTVPSMYNTNFSSCKPLLMEGKFKDDNSPEVFCIESFLEKQKHLHLCNNCYIKWKPKGCPMYFYTEMEMNECLRKISSEQKNLVFLGDSRVRAIYDQINKVLAHKPLPKAFHEDDNFFRQDTRTNVSMMWRTHLNDNTLWSIREIKSASTNKTLLVISITLHMLRDYSPDLEKGLTLFRTYLNEALEDLHELGRRNLVLWMVQPVRKVDFDNPSGFNFPRSKLKLMNEFIDAYNKEAIQILKETSVKIWHASNYMGTESLLDYKDTTHLPDYANFNLLQMIFNLLCNHRMNLNQRVCCNG